MRNESSGLWKSNPLVASHLLGPSLPFGPASPLSSSGQHLKSGPSGFLLGGVPPPTP